MVLYESVIGNNVFNNIIDYPELIKFINDGDLKKEYEKCMAERKERSKNGQNKS